MLLLLPSLQDNTGAKKKNQNLNHYRHSGHNRDTDFKEKDIKNAKIIKTNRPCNKTYTLFSAGTYYSGVVKTTGILESRVLLGRYCYLVVLKGTITP